MESTYTALYLPQSKGRGYYNKETGEITVIFKGQAPQKRKDDGILYHVYLDDEPEVIYLYHTADGIFINLLAFIDNYDSTEEIRNQID